MREIVLSPATEAEIAKRYQAGETMKQIAGRLGRSEPFVRRRLVKLGISPRDWRERGIATYSGYHKLVARVRGTPTTCEDCGTTDPTRRYEWASLTHNYSDVSDYKRLCRPCHMRRDEIHRRSGLTKRGRPWPRFQGEGHPMVKLTSDEVRRIRSRGAAGEQLVVLAAEFGVSDTHIRRIVTRQSWRYLP